MLCIFFKYITLVPLLDFISLMQLLWVFCISWVLDMQMIICIELISLHVWIFIPCVNEHCGHYLKWLFIFGQAMLYCFNIYFLITLCLLHMHFKLSTYNDHILLLFFRRYLFLWFKSYTDSRFWCEWVLFNCSQLTC